MTPKSGGRSPKKTREINKKLQSVGAASITPSSRRQDVLASTVDEEQVALSAWDGEDAATGISIISIIIAVFALVATVNQGYGQGTAVLVGSIAVVTIGLGYIIASARRSAAAAVAVINFRAQRQNSQLATEQSDAPVVPRRAFINVRVNRQCH